MQDIYKYYFGLIRKMSKYDDEIIMARLLTLAKQLNYYSEYNYHYNLMKLAHETGHDL